VHRHGMTGRTAAWKAARKSIGGRQSRRRSGWATQIHGIQATGISADVLPTVFGEGGDFSGKTDTGGANPRGEGPSVVPTSPFCSTSLLSP